ncbi:hypothetical protein Glove_46g25 [Diversispora epigaea]|uniref:Uncharacterized protein n=1 Tax=Diversispora epigaea TaxID=1348612 RepID=A0A397JP76_9GLOM|nr:hypothetical protein Glove_46g25 [Diversispora epigaea]
MDLGKARDRSKVLESMALRNKITKNINGIKEDIALLKEIVEKMINIYQVHGTRQPEAVKPEIGLEIIDLVANPDISRRKRTPCKVKRKKIILNDTTSSSSSESVSDSESDIEISE